MCVQPLHVSQSLLYTSVHDCISPCAHVRGQCPHNVAVLQKNTSILATTSIKNTSCSENTMWVDHLLHCAKSSAAYISRSGGAAIFNCSFVRLCKFYTYCCFMSAARQEKSVNLYAIALLAHTHAYGGP